jgi:transmembrane sensor
MNNFTTIRETDILIRYLAQETSDAERDLVHAWLEESPENANYLLQLEQLWDDSNDHTLLNEEYKADEAWEKVITKAEAPKSKNRIIGNFGWLSIAASLLLIIGAGFYFINYNKEIRITSTQKVIKITMPDKSVVWLNRNSELIYKKSYKKDRTIKFSGQGYFEVQHNPSNPFIIITKTAQIKVLGTKFNVNALPNSPVTEVTVKEGKVLLSRQSPGKEKEEIILTAGEKGLNVSNSEAPVKSKVEDPNYLSWKTREFQFNNTNIKEIVRIINDVYNTNVELSGENTEYCNLSGKFNCQSLDEILDMLRTVLNVTIEKKGNVIVINSFGCQ